MGLLVNDIIERAQEEAFEAGGVARPSWDVQSGTVDADDLTLTLESARPTGEVPPNALVEWIDDSLEMAEVKNATGPVATLQTRGYLSTSAAAHAAGAKVIFNPPYPRQGLVNGLRAIIGQLPGFGLYAMGYSAALTLNTTSPVQLPSDAIDILDPVLYQNGSNWFPVTQGTNFRVFYNFTGLNTAPALQFLGGGFQGASMKVWYKRKFTDPQDIYDSDVASPAAYDSVLDVDLDDVGVSAELQPHLATALAGHVLMGRDVPLLESEHIRPDPQNPQQPGTRINVGRALWSQFISGPVYSERVRLLQANPTTLVYERP